MSYSKSYNEWAGDKKREKKKKLKRKGFIDIKDVEKFNGVFSQGKQLNGEKLAFISSQIQHLFGLFHLRLGCIRTSNSFQEPKYYKLRNCFRSIVGLRVHLLSFRAATHGKSCLVFILYKCVFACSRFFFLVIFPSFNSKNIFIHAKKNG